MAAAPQHLRSLLPGIATAVALAITSYALAKLPGLAVMGPLTVALLLGIALRTAWGLPAALTPGARLTARTVLRVGVVLMGARLDFGLVGKVGPKILLLDLAIISVGLIGITWLARRFGVPGPLATLLAVGSSICGASAAVAAGSVLRAEEKDVTLAVALCGILGTMGVFFYVLGAPLLALTTPQLAILSGSTLHEVAQVMAAAFTWGQASGDLGTLVKLTRVVLLAPSLVILGLLTRADARGGIRYSWKEPPIPWFVIGFLAVGALGSAGVLSPVVKGWLSTASVFLMVAAMAAMGLLTQLAMIRSAGMKVLYAGLAGFGLLAAVSYALIHLLGVG